MGGVIGATSPKFVLVAATLLLHVRVDRTPATAIIDPSAPTTTISRHLADRLRLDVPPDGSPPISLRVGFGVESFATSPVGISDDPSGKEDIRIGGDVLAGHVFAIDFPHKTFRLVLSSAYRGLTRRYVAVPIDRSANGTLHLTARIGTTAPLDATLNLGSSTPLAVSGSLARALGPAPGSGLPPLDLHLGDADIPNIAIVEQQPDRAAAGAVIGLAAFAQTAVLLDFPHHRIWIRREGKSAP